VVAARRRASLEARGARTRTGPFDVPGRPDPERTAPGAGSTSSATGVQLDEGRPASTSVRLPPATTVKAHLEGGTIDLALQRHHRAQGTRHRMGRAARLRRHRHPRGLRRRGSASSPNPFGGCPRANFRRSARSAPTPTSASISTCRALLVSEISGDHRADRQVQRQPGPRCRDERLGCSRRRPCPNHWQLYIDPGWSIDLDVFDFADIVGNLLEKRASDAAIDTLLGPLPDWAKDLIRALLGPIIDVVRDILDIGPTTWRKWLEAAAGHQPGVDRT